MVSWRVGGGVAVGDEGERLTSGGAAGRNEDLVGSESEVGIGELSELTERRGEIDGGSRRHCQLRRRRWWRRRGLSLRVAKRKVSEEVSHSVVWFLKISPPNLL